MPEPLRLEKIPNLSQLGNVIPEGYHYYKKKISPDILLNINGACLKWYNLYPGDTEISNEQVQEAKKFLTLQAKAGDLKLKDELGFIILHRAGDYLLLLLTTWRQTNEIWESIYYKRADSDVDYIPMKFETDHKGTYCVWELGAVWHERNAWVRFIESNRDEEAKLLYLNDLFEGTI